MLFYLADEFLQIFQNMNLAIMAIIVSSATTTVLAFLFIITWKSMRENTKMIYSQLLRGFHEDLTIRLDKNSILKTTEDCQRYANDYLNTVDQIAFLDLNKKIPQGIATYLGRFFSYGLNIIDWYNGMIGEDFLKTAKKNWPNYFRYCETHNIHLNPNDKLPKIMLDYNQLHDNEKALEKKS